MVIKPVMAFAKKEILFILRNPFQFLCELFLPMLSILPSIFVAFTLIEKQGSHTFYEYSGTHNYLAFIFIGIIFYYFNDIQEQTAYLLQKELWMGTLEQIWFTPVSKLIILLGWTTFSFFKVLVYSLLGISTLFLFGLNLNIDISHINFISLGFGLLGLLSTSVAFGIIVSSIILVIKQADAFVYFVTLFVPLLSGVTYPISILPRQMQIISLISPLTYAYDLIRHAILNTNTLFPLHIEYLVMAILVILLLFLSHFIFNILRRRVEIWGTLYLK